MQQPNRSLTNHKMPYLENAQQNLLSTAAASWERLQQFVQHIPTLLVPQVVHVEVSLESQLSDAIAQAVRDRSFRQELLDRPKQTLASLNLRLPPQQEIVVLEATSTQTYLVLPIATEREIEALQAGVNSHRSLRAIRSKILLQAFADPEYRSRLVADPKAVLTEAGFQMSIDTNVQVLENSLEHLYLVIPAIH
jgi:Nitrile hydratase, alpha chain